MGVRKRVSKYRDRIIGVAEIHDVHTSVAEVSEIGVLPVTPDVGIVAGVTVPGGDEVRILGIVLGQCLDRGERGKGEDEQAGASHEILR